MRRLARLRAIAILGTLSGLAALLFSALNVGQGDPSLAPLVAAQARADDRSAAPDRSPVDLVLAPDDSWLVTANQTSASVSLVSTARGAVLDELPVGERPAAIALRPPGPTVLVSCAAAGQLVELRVKAGRLERLRAIEMNGEPHGIAVTADGATAYVALTALDQLAVVDLGAGAVTRRIDVGRWPRYLALSPDGTRLAVGTGGDRGVSVVDTQAGKLLYIERFVGLNIGHLQASRDGQYAYFPWMVYRRNPITFPNIREGWVLASRIARVRLDGPARREAVSLDPQGRAIADPHGLALTRDEQRLVVSAAGTHELLVYRLPDLPLQAHGGTDHVPDELLDDADRFFRIELGGRPLGLRIAGDDRTVYVANYLRNSVQVVDLEQRRVVRRIALGGPQQPSLARRGEAIFYDARRSLDQWYSCHSCHYEGGTNAVAMDTMNDGTRYTVKTVAPLYHVDQTGPWTWHGWQQSLSEALHKSITSTMLGPEPTAEDTRALLAFLSSLRPPRNPYRAADGSLDQPQARGRELFHSERAGCASCHSGPYFTDDQIHDVGLSRAGDRYQGFNTPSLVGLHRKVGLLHDGRAASLEELLTGPHAPPEVSGGDPLKEAELQDLIAYLKTL